MFCYDGGWKGKTLDLVRRARPGSYLFKNIKNGLFWLFFAIILLPEALQASENDTLTGALVRVDTISVQGNRRTRLSYVLRELDIHKGDLLPHAGLAEKLEFNRLRLLNTGLFTRVELLVIPLMPDSSRLHLHFTVYENLYIYPIPVFELADRNFNVWWKEFDHSFKRVNYGLDLSHLNFTGQADVLKLNVVFGYSNKYNISYKIPYINRKQTIGFQTSLSYSRSKEVAFKTDGNKLQFEVNPDDWQITKLYANAGITWRPQFFNRHTLIAEFHKNNVSENIASDLNPDFFLDGKTRQHHLSLIYNLIIDYRDIHPYPLKGHRWVFEARGNGLLPNDDLTLFRFFAEYDQYSKRFLRPVPVCPAANHLISTTRPLVMVVILCAVTNILCRTASITVW
jgi:Omp85 superfamily domain